MNTQKCILSVPLTRHDLSILSVLLTPTTHFYVVGLAPFGTYSCSSTFVRRRFTRGLGKKLTNLEKSMIARLF